MVLKYANGYIPGPAGKAMLKESRQIMRDADEGKEPPLSYFISHKERAEYRVNRASLQIKCYAEALGITVKEAKKRISRQHLSPIVLLYDL